MNAPPPDPIALARWRALAFALAATSAVLSGLLLLTVAHPAPPTPVEPGTASDAQTDAQAEPSEEAPAGEVEAGAAPAGRGVLSGVIELNGALPEPRASAPRREGDLCKYRPLPSNAVLVKDRGLKDVLVRIEYGGVKGEKTPPGKRLTLAHQDCLYSPRIQGALVGQEIELSNHDSAFHNIHGFRASQSFVNVPQPKGAAPAVRTLDVPGIYKFTCDVHPWERAFVIVTDHPFFAVTDDNGAFAIPDVPAGHYTVEAWHSRYGLRRVSVDVGDAPAVVKVTYESSDPEPEINRGEPL